MRFGHRVLIIGSGIAGFSDTLRAQQPVVSLGQPPVWAPYLAAGSLLGNGASGGLLSAGVHRYLLNPVTGILGFSGEGYALVRNGARPGVRLMATSPALGIATGVDFDARAARLDAIVRFETAIRRGGLFGHGTMLRADWLPARHNTFDLGVRIPVAQPFAGRTRARDTDADFPVSARQATLDDGALPADVEHELEAVRDAAALIRAYTNLYSADNERTLTAGRGAPSYDAATRAYTTSLIRAFGLAAGDTTRGARIAARARAGVLERVLIPYDSLFGQIKEHSADIRALTTAAHQGFLAWVRDSARLTGDAGTRVTSVHARWLGTIEAVHHELSVQWKDSRLVWLPLQLALTPDQYDEQAEVDALIARAVGQPFTDGNALAYLRSSDLPLEIARSIFATRHYHVLSTHDFTGRRASGEIDDVAYRMVADAYLPALTQAVARYDSTGGIPVYMILLDQFFYSARDGALWMTILEDPLNASMRLPGDAAGREAHLRERQQELRAAVAKSARLQHDAITHGDAGRWLRDVVKVHVNIVEPSDFSFRSRRLLPPIPFTPDNIARDHRKAVIYDVTEANPYQGAMILTGVGVGEWYASPTWDDRGYRIRGPAALEMRAAIRRIFKAHGFADADIPEPLRAVANGKAVEENANADRYVGRALQVHNDVGFGEKASSVARAMLYSLAPPGSVIIVPDPLWVSDTWAAMVAGAAARGCRVFVVAPAAANDPNPEPTVIAAQHDVLTRLLQIRERMAAELKLTGGELRVGLYTAAAEVGDVVGRAREVRDGLARAPWIRSVFPFDSATVAVLSRTTTQTEANVSNAALPARDEKPRLQQLHQKTQLIARPGAIAALVRQPGWADVLARSLRIQSQETARFADQLGYTTPDVDTAATRRTDALLRAFEASLSDQERRAVSFYFSLGTQNEDPRGIMLDGEASLVVSGFNAAAGVVDLYYLMARTTWVDSAQEVERLLPMPRGLFVRLRRLIRFAL